MAVYGHVRTLPSIFKLFLDPVRAGMDTCLSQGSFARIDELVGHTGRHQDNLPSSHFQRGVAHRIGSLAFMNHKYLLIGIAVQWRPLPRWQVSEGKGDTRRPIPVSLKHIRTGT